MKRSERHEPKQPVIAPPLSNAVTHILLALAHRDLHGYGIMQEILLLSNGEYKVGPGTLYDNLRSLLAAGLVTEYAEQGGEGEPRRMYRLTEAGAGVLQAETRRLRLVVKAAGERLAAGRAGGN